MILCKNVDFQQKISSETQCSRISGVILSLESHIASGKKLFDLRIRDVLILSYLKILTMFELRNLKGSKAFMASIRPIVSRNVNTCTATVGKIYSTIFSFFGNE